MKAIVSNDEPNLIKLSRLGLVAPWVKLTERDFTLRKGICQLMTISTSLTVQAYTKRRTLPRMRRKHGITAT